MRPSCRRSRTPYARLLGPSATPLCPGNAPDARCVPRRTSSQGVAVQYPRLWYGRLYGSSYGDCDGAGRGEAGRIDSYPVAGAGRGGWGC